MNLYHIRCGDDGCYTEDVEAARIIREGFDATPDTDNGKYDSACIKAGDRVIWQRAEAIAKWGEESVEDAEEV